MLIKKKSMKTNLWFYHDQAEKSRTAGRITIFGAEIFKRAKIIRDIERLKAIQNNEINFDPFEMREFIFEYVNDCVKIILFFENYMKAELIMNDICVHRINKDINEFELLAKKQFNEPVSIKEIDSIESFKVNESEKISSHRAINVITIGMKEMINNRKYLDYFSFDSKIIKFLRFLNIERNRLHFLNSAYFNLSEDKICELVMINSFIEKIVTEKLKPISR